MRRVRVSSISFERHGDPETVLETALRLVDRAGEAQPDIIALPENCINSIASPQPVPGPITDAMASRARQYNAYIVIPLLQQADDKRLYNTAVLLDRDGSIVGEYRKMFPTDGEMKQGVIPGTKTPVFSTDFGRVGMAICFDLNFREVIQGLVAGGVEIVFFVSAYEGGRQLQHWALEHGVYITSAHRGGTGYFVDKTGRVLERGDAHYHPVITRDLNLDRFIFHLDYNHQKLPNIVRKYGRGVSIEVYRPEAIFAFESMMDDVTVADIAAEFDLESYSEYMDRSRGLRHEILSRPGR